MDININALIVRGRQQRIFPDIYFGCNGYITKWIVGARYRPHGLRLPQLQLWRQNAHSQNLEFVKIGFEPLLAPYQIHPNVYEYISNPPLEFQEGDILGMFQPVWTDSQTVVQYQQDDGPVNRALYNQDFAPCTIGLAYMHFNYDYPLISAKISISESAGANATKLHNAYLHQSC